MRGGWSEEEPGIADCSYESGEVWNTQRHTTAIPSPLTVATSLRSVWCNPASSLSSVHRVHLRKPNV